MLCAFRSPLFLALAALALLLGGMELAWPGFFLHDDNASWFAGAYAQDFRTLTGTGELAEVNFYQYGGEPFLEQGQTAVLYPPVYVAGALASLWPGDLRATVDWLAAIHLALAVSGFYVWLRRGGADARVAALGGLVWALNPFVLLLGASWIMVTAAAAWLPWLFWAVDLVVANGERKIIRGPSTALGRASTDKENFSPRSAQDDGFLKSGLRRGIPLGLIAGIFVLQGYVQWAAYAFLFAVIYAAYWLYADRGSRRPPGDGGGDFGEPQPRLRESTSPSRGARRLPRIAALIFSAVVAAVIALPQVLPLWHGAAESKARAEELSPMFELFYRVEPGDLLAAQVGFFREHFLFGASTALLFCPALVLLPIAVIAFVRGDEKVRRRLFVLILLAGIALVFSGRGYFLLNVVPFMAKFRWPFKVFLFAEFFLVAGLVWGLASWGSRRPPGDGSAGLREPQPRLRESPSPAPGGRGLPLTLLAAIVVLQVVVALVQHLGNFLSSAVLPVQHTALPPEVDPTRGRIIAAGDVFPMAEADRYYALAYSTFFEAPSIGGYNPLVSRESLAFSQGMDVPNFWSLPVTPEVRAVFQDRAVRYWIVKADSAGLLMGSGRSGTVSQASHPEPVEGSVPSSSASAGGTDPSASLGMTNGPRPGLLTDGAFDARLEPSPGFRLIGGDRSRWILEDMGAKPLAFEEAQPLTSLPVRYVGNSMRIGLPGVAGTVAVSVGPSDGWWYRVDGDAWKQSGYRDYRLQVPVGAGSRELEVRYFDSRLRSGLCISLIISVLLGLGYFLLPGLRARVG